jgi:SulP family sulfate permease
MGAMALQHRLKSFRPRLLDHLPSYKRTDLVADVSAGLTVGMVALPLAMTFAMASGLSPQAGLVTAIVAGLIISLFGGSSFQIGGPAGAFIVVVYAIVERYGVPNLLVATACSGVLLIFMGLFRMGDLVRLIPISIVAGFTSGIAILIALSQVKEFLGLSGDPLPAEFFAKVQGLITALPSIDPLTVIVGSICLIIILAWPKSNVASDRPLSRTFSRLPGSLIAIGLSTLFVVVFQLPVETVGSRFGAIPKGFPMPSLPEFDWGKVQFLFGPIITIAMLGAVESLLCARVADGLTKTRHDPNQELMAQGLANIASPLFGGFCATGNIARTVTNIRSGARSPIAGVVHALSLLVVVLVAAPLAEFIPLTALAATALVVAYNMGDWRVFADMRHHAMPYRLILIVTFVLTIVLDITVAVQVGLTMACVFFIWRVSQLTRVEKVSDEERSARGLEADGVEIRRLTGILFFGAVSCLEPLMNPKLSLPKTLVLDCSALLAIDSTGTEALRSLDDSLASRGTHLLLASVRPEPLQVMTRLGLIDDLGSERLFPTIQGALGLR